jgi:small subunit ribosomal protein S6
MQNHYELCYLVSATFSDEELIPLKERIADMIKKFGGNITFEENLGRRRLAYAINHQLQGSYLLFEFDLDGAKLKDLEKTIRLSGEVMRHIVVKRDPKAPRQQISIAERAERFAAKAEQLKEVEPVKESASEGDKDKDKDKGKFKIEDLDQKLDDILEGKII